MNTTDFDKETFLQIIQMDQEGKWSQLFSHFPKPICNDMDNCILFR